MGTEDKGATCVRGAAVRALAADGPDPEHVDALRDFGQLVGSWDVEVAFYDTTGDVTERRRAEWHFGWVLEGRAVQDVLTGPPAVERRVTGAPAREYGSSMRMYDRHRRLWHVSWFAPIGAVVVHLTGGRRGEELVLEGVEQDGTNCRWVFAEMTSNRFVWSGYESKLDIDDKPLVQRMHARRAAS